jgi:hypothetical protein
MPEIPLATFVLAKPDLRFGETYGNWNVNFGLALHLDERAHYLPKVTLPENTQQSDRVFYTCGLSFGYIKDNVYVMPKLVEFMAACFGLEGGKAFRKWMEEGGGSPRPLDRDDDKAELQMIGDWLGWMEGLMVYGSVRHEPDRANAGQMRSRYGGPLPLGSLPGAPEKEYQQIGLGKYRSMRTETEKADHDYEASLKAKAPTPLPARSTRSGAQSTTNQQINLGNAPEVRYDAEGNEVNGTATLHKTAAPSLVDNGNDDDPPF